MSLKSVRARQIHSARRPSDGMDVHGVQATISRLHPTINPVIPVQEPLPVLVLDDNDRTRYVYAARVRVTAREVTKFLRAPHFAA